MDCEIYSKIRRQSERQVAALPKFLWIEFVDKLPRSIDEVDPQTAVEWHRTSREYPESIKRTFRKYLENIQHPEYRRSNGLPILYWIIWQIFGKCKLHNCRTHLTAAALGASANIQTDQCVRCIFKLKYSTKYSKPKKFRQTTFRRTVQNGTLICCLPVTTQSAAPHRTF